MLAPKLTSCVLLLYIVSVEFSSLSSALCQEAGSPFTFYEKAGELASPGYPTQYYGGEQCLWNLYPARGSWSDLLIMNLYVETNVDGLPDADNVCYSAKNYVGIGDRARACGKEGPVCLAFMVLSRPDHKCHMLAMNHFPHCHVVMQSGWPFQVSFVTSEADTKAGFNLNYTFYDCDVGLPSTTTTTTTSLPTESGQTYPPSANRSTSSTTTTTTSTTPKTTSTTTTTERSPKTDKSLAPTRKTVSILKTSTEKSVKDIDPAPQNANTTLIIVLAVLCVIFICVVISVIFRKRIRTWVREKPDGPKKTESRNSNGTVVSTDALVPVTSNFAYEVPIQPPPIPPVYRSESFENRQNNNNKTENNSNYSNNYDKLDMDDSGNTINTISGSVETTYSTIDV